MKLPPLLPPPRRPKVTPSSRPRASRNGRCAALIGAALLPGCLGQEMRQSTPAERAEIEGGIRACGLPMRDVRWTRVEGLGQWELGFDTDPAAMRDDAARACVDAVTDRLISPRRLDVMIGYAGIPAAAEAGAR
jgi:hypothetical protein